MSRTGDRFRLIGGTPKAFTLIEVLVVVAIIALLISILLPSLSAAKERGKTVSCVSNIRQIGIAFQMYATVNTRFPGSAHDRGVDWMGWPKRCPQDGTIYKYLGKMTNVYQCPKDAPPKTIPINFSSWFSYQYNALLVMAKPETPTAAHYPAPLSNAKPSYNRDDHTVGMKPFDGVPLLVEPSFVPNGLDTGTGSIDGRWLTDGYSATAVRNNGCLTARHDSKNKKDGAASIAYVDGHAGTVKLGGVDRAEQERGMASHGNDPYWYQSQYFYSAAHCVRSGRKWVSGRAADPNVSTAQVLNWGDSKNVHH